MKHTIVLFTTAVLFAALIFSACDSRSNKLERAETSVIEANRDLEIAKSEVEAELRIYRNENANRRMEFNRTISEIKPKIENETDSEIQARLESRLNRHEATHRELKREIDNYRVSGRDNWNDFKDNFSNRMDNLSDSLNTFFSNNRTTSRTNN